MHGILMELIDSNYADYLHSEQTRPYSQSVSFDKNLHELHWTITALTKNATENIFPPLLSLEKAP